VATQQSLLAIIDDVLYYVDSGCSYQKRIVVPKNLKDKIWKRYTVGR